MVDLKRYIIHAATNKIQYGVSSPTADWYLAVPKGEYK